MSLEHILRVVATLTNRRPPRVRLPRAAVFPVAVAGEWLARLTGLEPPVTLDGLRMSRKHMYFSSRRAEAALGYRWRDPERAIGDALTWFRENDYLK